MIAVSETATQRVWSLSGARNGARLVLLALAQEHDTHGQIRVSEGALAERTLFTVRHIRNCLTELVSSEELRLVRRGGGQHNPSEYEITLSSSEKSGPETTSRPEDESGTPVQETGTVSTADAADFPEDCTPNRNSTAGDRNSGQGAASRTHAVGTPFGSTPSPSKPASAGSTQNDCARSDDSVPDASRPLVNALTSAGMLVGWRLTDSEWQQVATLIKRWGTERLVEFTNRRWDPARPPKSARYLLKQWSDLPAIASPTEPGNVVPLRPRPGAWQPYRNATPAATYENGF